MKSPILYSIIESPAHPNLSALYRRLGFNQLVFTSMRKAIAHLKREPPDIVVADFLFGYGNNYAGANISNLDVFLRSLQKYASDPRVIVLVEKSERPYVDRLAELVPIHLVLNYPVTEEQMIQLLFSE